MIKPSFTYDQAATQIATFGWANAATIPITYGFTSSDPTSPGFARFSAALIDAGDAAMALWSDVANIKFQRVGTGDTGNAAYTNNATILFAGDTASGGYGWTYFPGDRAASSIDGNVYLNTSGGNFADTSNGSYEFMALIHEVGHALGLDHPGAYNGGSPTYALDAGYLQDSRQYTVMSYFDAEETGALHNWNYASTPLLHDIAAIQKLYGANYATRAGDTVYGFNSNADRAQYHVTAASQQVVFAIWDGGGNDTLDFSGYSQNEKIDLHFEAFSNVGGLIANVAIARGAVIENAVGGSGNDTIIGNAAANALFGGAGSDDLRGGVGNDRLDGGSGIDTVEFAGASADYVFNLAADGSVMATDHIAGRDGLDTIVDIENAHFSDGTFVIASLITATPAAGAAPVTASYGSIGTTVVQASNGLGDTLTGTSVADACFGGSGDDVVIGLGGNDKLSGGDGGDILVGGRGLDIMTGGAGADVFEFDFKNETGIGLGTRDVIKDFEHLVDKIDLHNIDANGLAAGDQAFTLNAQPGFHHIAGELYALRVDLAGTASDRTVVLGDTNGDGLADFAIQLKGLVTLTAADFVL